MRVAPAPRPPAPRGPVDIPRRPLHPAARVVRSPGRVRRSKIPRPACRPTWIPHSRAAGDDSGSLGDGEDPFGPAPSAGSPEVAARRPALARQQSQRKYADMDLPEVRPDPPGERAPRRSRLQRPAPHAPHAPHARPRPQGSKAKMALLVRGDLGMKGGKVATQCCHAAVGAYRRVVGSPLCRRWEEAGGVKVCLRVEGEGELVARLEAARRAGLPTYCAIDGGRTQVAPHSRTVLAVGPGPAEAVDAVCGDLRLLGGRGG